MTLYSMTSGQGSNSKYDSINYCFDSDASQQGTGKIAKTAYSVN